MDITYYPLCQIEKCVNINSPGGRWSLCRRQGRSSGKAEPPTGFDRVARWDVSSARGVMAGKHSAVSGQLGRSRISLLGSFHLVSMRQAINRIRRNRFQPRQCEESLRNRNREPSGTRSARHSQKAFMLVPKSQCRAIYPIPASLMAAAESMVASIDRSIVAGYKICLLPGSRLIPPCAERR